MQSAAKSVAENVMLAAVARIILLVGTPLMIGVLTWFSGNFIALQQITAVQAAEQARIVSEIRELQEYRREAYGRGRSMQADLVTIKEMLARLQNHNDRPARN